MVEADAVDNVEVEPSFDDPEDFIDEIDDAEIVGDVLRQEPSIEEYENYSLLLFGLPIVNKDKFPKLRNVITKILDGISPAGHSEEYPIDEATGMSKGTAFIEWPDADTAAHAKAVLDKYALDKNHTFSAILFSEVKKVTKPDDDWKPPEPQKYNDVGDLWSWMQNTRCRDQFAVHYHKNGSANVSVYWNIKGHEPQLVNDHADKQGWTETYFDWSPYGSYLATIHRQGVALWGGETFQKFQRFAHENVHYIDFSPKETYLVTFAFTEDKWNDDSEVLRIWDVVTGELKRSFSLYALTNRNELSGWPFFQWSQDEKYFACLKKPEKDKLEKEKRISGITVFSSETMAPLDKKGITVEGIRQFKWSPASNMIGYYSESSADLPAELGVVSVPVVANNRSRSSRIYNVGEANLYWQKSGAHLAVHTLRYNKKALKDNGEVKYIGGCKSHIEIFEVESKDISVQTLELAEPFIDFGWEPTGAQGDKFCVLVGTNNKAMPLVYKLDKTKHTPMLISKLEAGVQLNTVAWAPAGGWLVVYSARSTGGNVAFIDTNGTEAKRTNLAEHPGFNKGYWDPTGRYFVTCSTSGGRLGADLGYRLYTFQGRELVRKNLDKLSQFKWRPRPPVKLSEEKQKEIRKNLKTIAQRFEKEDNEERVKASQEVVDKRRKIMAAFELIRKRNLEEYKKLREKRLELRDGVDTEAELLTDDLVEEKVTVALSTQKIAVEAADDEE